MRRPPSGTGPPAGGATERSFRRRAAGHYGPVPAASLDVYLEIGRKRCFAAALDWPGWCRSGRTEEEALENLGAYLGRYRAVLAASRSAPPATAASRMRVMERLSGGSGTDFGAPEKIPEADWRPLEGAERERQLDILVASWGALDRIGRAAAGWQLATGPRGGGRSRQGILDHVREAERSYLARVGGHAGGTGQPTGSPGPDPVAADPLRAAALEWIGRTADGLVAPTGPRGGRRWPARYAVRRFAWHVLDHAWEMEDRMGEPPGS